MSNVQYKTTCTLFSMLKFQNSDLKFQKSEITFDVSELFFHGGMVL